MSLRTTFMRMRATAAYQQGNMVDHHELVTAAAVKDMMPEIDRAIVKQAEGQLITYKKDYELSSVFNIYPRPHAGIRMTKACGFDNEANSDIVDSILKKHITPLIDKCSEHDVDLKYCHYDNLATLEITMGPKVK